MSFTMNHFLMLTFQTCFTASSSFVYFFGCIVCLQVLRSITKYVQKTGYVEFYHWKASNATE